MPRTKAFDETTVLQKAMELFWKQGFHATSMQNLVDHLGISRASIYETYGNKKSLYDKAFERYRSQNQRRIKQFLAEQTDAKTGMEKLFLSAVTESAEDTERKGCFVVNCISELAALDADILQKLARNQTEFLQFFRSYLEEGQQKGQLAADMDLDATATYLFTLYNGLRVVSKVETDPDQLKEVIKVGLTVLG